MKNNISDIKNTPEGKKKLNEAESRINNLEDKVEKHIQSEQPTKKKN